MAAFKITLMNEVEKLYKQKKVWVALILSFAVVIFQQLAIMGVRGGLGLRGAGSMDFPVLVLSIVVNTILPLFTLLIAIDAFSGEFSRNTIKLALLRPVTRLKLFSAKVSAIGLFVLMNLAFVLLLSLLVGFMFNTFSGDIGVLGKVGVAYLVTFFPMMVLALVVVLIAHIVKSGVGVFFTTVLLFLVFKVLGLVFSEYASLFFTSMLDWYHLMLADVVPLGRIVRQFLIMLGFGTMLFTAGFYLFEKKEC